MIHVIAAAPAGVNSFMSGGGAIVILVIGIFLIISGRRG